MPGHQTPSMRECWTHVAKPAIGLGTAIPYPLGIVGRGIFSYRLSLPHDLSLRLGSWPTTSSPHRYQVRPSWSRFPSPGRHPDHCGSGVKCLQFTRRNGLPPAEWIGTPRGCWRISTGMVYRMFGRTDTDMTDGTLWMVLFLVPGGVVQIPKEAGAIPKLCPMAHGPFPPGPPGSGSFGSDDADGDGISNLSSMHLG